MSSTSSSASQPSIDLTSGRWLLDPARSTVEFRVPHFWGLMTVKGHFERYQGSLDLHRDPVVELTIEAGSLDTGNRMRDRHLRSADFFDVEHHPEVRFVSDSAVLHGDVLSVRGELDARGSQIPLELDANIHVVDGELRIEAEAHAIHRDLGMTWSPAGITRSYSKLIVTGQLVPAASTGDDSADAHAANNR